MPGKQLASEAGGSLPRKEFHLPSAARCGLRGFLSVKALSHEYEEWGCKLVFDYQARQGLTSGLSEITPAHVNPMFWVDTIPLL